MSTPTRVHAEVPTGGQFAAITHAESDVTLADTSLAEVAHPDPVARDWHRAGLIDTDAQAWIDAGFSPPTNVPSRFADWDGTQDIETWVELGMDPSHARLLESRGSLP